MGNETRGGGGEETDTKRQRLRRWRRSLNCGHVVRRPGAVLQNRRLGSQDLRFTTVVRELDDRVQGSPGACIEFDDARIAPRQPFSSCEARVADGFVQGSRV